MVPDRSEIGEIAPLVPHGLPLGLRNYWYPILQSEELPADRPVGLMVLGEALAAWRDGNGRPCVVRDRCPHRGVALSRGRVLDGDLQCVLHGLRFDGEGQCVLIPWETEQNREGARPNAQAYRAEELGGYVWAYLGAAAAFPPPPLAREVPEELSNPDAFVWFRMPTEIWRTNWLLAIDGSDAYHAVVLHANSQAVAAKTWTGGQAEKAEIPLARRRMRIVKTAHGLRSIATDEHGNALHHGHLTSDLKGDRFVLPCIHSNPIAAAPGAAPYTARLWQFPVDESHTQIVRYAVWRGRNEEERARAQRIFEELTLPRFKQVSQEDAMVAEAQGDLVTARSNEYLLTPDADIVSIRRLIRQAFLTQSAGQRVAVPDGALVFPI